MTANKPRAHRQKHPFPKATRGLRRHRWAETRANQRRRLAQCGRFEEAIAKKEPARSELEINESGVGPSFKVGKRAEYPVEIRLPAPQRARN